jgi:hypothetical protein
MQGCIDSWPVSHHRRPERLFALHLTRLPLGEKRTPLLAATGTHVLCACPCGLRAMLPVTRSWACTSAHVAYKAVAMGDFPAHHALPHQPVGNRGRLRMAGLQASIAVEDPARRIGRQSISSSSGASLHPGAYLVTSRQASLAPTTHALTIVAAGHLFSQCPASMQGPIPPAHNLISGTLRANEARGDSASL